MSRLAIYGFVLSVTFVVGCGAEPPVSAGPAQTPATPDKPSAFNPAECGVISGAVTWVGPIPQVPQITHSMPRPDGSGFNTRVATHPNAPRVDQFTRGLEGAVVFLRQVETTHAKPWDHPPVTVEFRDSQIWVKQGTRTARTGFVRRGAEVTFQSAEPDLQVLRASGAAFFALPFPDANQPLTRTLPTCGRVDLTNASWLYWESAELFVCDHPYYAVTDKAGRFEFTQVPTGIYDLVAWHPNWVATRTDRNPETGLPCRLHYAAPLESHRPVGVVPGRYTLANLTLPQ